MRQDINNIKLINNHIEWIEENDEKIIRYVISTDEMINAYKKQNEPMRLKNFLKKDYMTVGGGCPNCGCYVSGKSGKEIHCSQCGQYLELV